MSALRSVAFDAQAKADDPNRAFKAIRELVEIVQYHVIARDRNDEHENGALEQFRRMGSSKFKSSSDLLKEEV